MGNSGFADLAAESASIAQNESRRRSSNAFRAMATPELATQIASAAQNYPNLPGALILSGSLAGLAPEADEWKLMEEEQVKLNEENWGHTGLAPMDYLLNLAQGTWGIQKAAVRGGMITFETLWEEALPHGLRTAVNMYQDESLGFTSAWKDASPSTGLRAAGQFMGDPAGNLATTVGSYLNLLTPFADPFEFTTESRVNIGSGFFAKSDLVSNDNHQVQQLQKKGYTEQEAIIAASTEEFGSPSSQLWRDGAESVRITGSNGISTGVSLGRLGAMMVSEPGSTPFNWISGSIDAGSQVFLDPSNILTGGLSKGRLAARSLQAADESHGLIKGLRNTVFKTDAENAWSTGVGLGFAQAMTDSDDFYHIYSSLKSSAKGRQPSRALVEQLQQSKDLTKTRDILVNASGTELVKKPWNTSLTGSLLGLDQTVRGKAFAQISDYNGMSIVNKKVAQVTEDLMPNYGGYRPGLRQRLESNFMFEGGDLRRNAGSRNGRMVSRTFAQMAGRYVNASNLDRGMGEIVDMARALDSTPEEMQDALKAWSALDDGADFGHALNIVENLLVPYRDKLRALGISESVIKERTAVYKNLDEMRRYFVDRAGNIEDPGVFTMLLGNGDEIPVPLAHALSEASTNMIPVPGRDGGRTLRRMTDYLYRSEGVMNKLRLEEGGKVRDSIFYNEEFNSRVGVRAADSFTGLWRNMVLLRPAWTLRVVGEEQARLAAEGLHVINNPFKAFMLATSNKNLKLGMQTRKKLLQSDLFGNSLQYSEDYMQSMSRRSGGWFDSPGGYGSETWIKVAQDDDNYTKFWFRELNQLQSDEAANFMARAITDPVNPMSIDDVKVAFKDGDLAHVRDELANSGSSSRHRALQTDEGADAYIDSMFARIHLKTGGRYKTLRDDGFWYDDLGERIGEATEADLGILRQSANWGPNTAAGSKVRIKTRTHAEYEMALTRSGRSQEHIDNTMTKLQRETSGDDRVFQALDPDRRTVMLDAERIGQSDTIATARVVKYEIVENGNEELIRSLGDGDFRGVNFDGSIDDAIEGEMIEALGSFRGEGDIIVPDYVKGVEETDKSALYNNFINTMFDTFMGKPTNRYSRSPAFYRAYWRAMDDLVAQGVVDDRTSKSIQALLTDAQGTPIQKSVLKASLARSDRMEQQLKDTDLLIAKYNQEFGDLTGPAGEVVDNLTAKLAKLANDDVYDVSVFGRAMDGAKRDLDAVDKEFDVALAKIRKSETVSIEERHELVRNLEAKRHEIQQQLKNIDSLRDDALDAVDDVRRKAMDEMGGDGYIGGLDPANSEALSARPTSQEGIINRRISELEQQGATERRIVSRTDVRPDEVEIVGKRPASLEPTPDGPKGRTGKAAQAHADKAESYARELGIPVQWRTLKATGKGKFKTHEVHMGATAGRGTTGEFKIVFTRTADGPMKSEVMRKVKGRWKKASQKDLDLWAKKQKRAVQRTKVTERTEAIPAETPRGPEWDQYADEIAMDEFDEAAELEIMSLSAREKEIAKRELGATEADLRDADQIPKFKDEAGKRVRSEKARTEMFEDSLVDRPQQLMSISEADNFAKATALTATQDLLYDLSNKSAASDMLRNIMPFSEAWWEIVSTWSRLVQANPKVLQQFQKVYNGLEDDARPFDWTDIDGEVHQGALPGAEMEVQDYDGSGFFYVDPQSEQEMFALPYFSQILSGNSVAGAAVGGAVGAGLGGFFAGASGAGATGALIGGAVGAAAGVGLSKAGLVPEGESVDLGFSAQGLNMASQSPVPGLGPLAAVPVSWVLNLGGEAWEPIEDLMLPFGEPDTETPGSFLNNVIPPYAKKFMQATGLGADEDALRIRANTTMEVAAMMVRQKEGSFNTQAQMRSTLAEASKRAGWLYAIRGLASAAAPTSAAFEFSTEDSNGTWFATQTMSNEWNRISQEMGGDPVATFDEFVGLYGIDPRTFMKGKTDTIRQTSYTEQGYAWEKEHEAMFKEFPDTAYYVNPDSPLDTSFDYEAYLKSLKDGTRQALTPEQWAMKSNQLAANVIYERFRQSADGYISANGSGKAAMFQVNQQLYGLKEALRKDYPGYGMQIAGTVRKLSLEEQLVEFSRWTPEMYNTEAGQGLKLYLAAREKAQSQGMHLGFSRDWWKTSTDWQAVQLRQELQAVAAATYMKHPKFQAVYVGVFSNELKEG